MDDIQRRHRRRDSTIARGNESDWPEGHEVHPLKPSPGSIPRVMLVVDRSYSMIVEEDRWSPIENTLSRVTDSLRDTVQFGLVFPSPASDFRGSEAEMAIALRAN